MSRHRVLVRCSLELLHDLIGLDDTHRIVAIVPLDENDFFGGTVRLLIEGDGLPSVPEGAVPPVAECIITHSGHGHTARIEWQ